MANIDNKRKWQTLKMRERGKENKKMSEHTMLLHNLQELNDDFRGWSNQHLSFAGLRGIVDSV